LKPGDLVSLNDIATAYTLGELDIEKFEKQDCYGMLIECRDYVFEEKPPHESKREKVWTVLVGNETYDILELDLTLKSTADK